MASLALAGPTFGLARHKIIRHFGRGVFQKPLG